MNHNALMLKTAEKALEKATNGIARDFFEIENLQSSNTLEKFTMISLNKIQNTIVQELEKYHNLGIYVYDDKTPIVNTSPKSELMWNVMPVDSKMNLLHGSRDFFSSIALEKFDNEKKDSTHQTIAALISEPLLQEVYRVELGGGSFTNNRRLRVSNRNRLLTTMIDANWIFDKNSEQTNILPELRPLLAKCGSWRVRGSGMLSLVNVAAGKSDLGLLVFKNPLAIQKYTAGILLLKEAGGFCQEIPLANATLLLFGNSILCEEAEKFLPKV